VNLFAPLTSLVLPYGYGDGTKTTFKVNGEIDFFGEDALAPVTGAGRPDSTTRAYAFSIPVAAWLSVPLHR
jgi:hypothetical protein